MILVTNTSSDETRQRRYIHSLYRPSGTLLLLRLALPSPFYLLLGWCLLLLVCRFQSASSVIAVYLKSIVFLQRFLFLQPDSLHFPVSPLASTAVTFFGRMGEEEVYDNVWSSSSDSSNNNSRMMGANRVTLPVQLVVVVCSAEGKFNFPVPVRA